MAITREQFDALRDWVHAAIRAELARKSSGPHVRPALDAAKAAEAHACDQLVGQQPWYPDDDPHWVELKDVPLPSDPDTRIEVVEAWERLHRNWVSRPDSAAFYSQSTRKLVAWRPA